MESLKRIFFLCRKFNNSSKILQKLRVLGGQVFLDVSLGESFEGGFGDVRESSFGLDGLEKWLLGGSDVSEEFKFEVGDVGWGNFVQVTSDAAEDAGDLFGNVHWGVLVLFKKFGKSNTSVKKLLGGGVHIGTELGKGGDLSVLGQIQLHGAGDLFHGFELGSGTDSGDGETDVDCWSDTFMEQFSFQENLTVSNRNDVGWDVS